MCLKLQDLAAMRKRIQSNLKKPKIIPKRAKRKKIQEDARQMTIFEFMT